MMTAERDNAMTKEQAITTLTQLTGRKNPFNTLKVMIGASNFCVGPDGVGFKFKMCRFANYCLIRLNGADTYDMSFIRVRGFEMKDTKRFDSLYFYNLKETFEQETGLRLSLF